MNRIIFSLVSYFVCSLFFVGLSNATVIKVTSTSNDPGTTNTGALGWAVNQANTAGGSDTILLQADGATWGVGLTLSASNVTIMAAPSGCDASHSISMVGAAFNITGSNCVISGINFVGTTLQLTGSNNRVWGCWFNMNAAGTAGQTGSLNNGAALFINGSSNNIIGLTGKCRNVFSGTSMDNMIRVDGPANNTVISNNYLGYAKNGTTIIGTANIDAINFTGGSATGCRIDSNSIAATTADAIKIASTFTSSFIRKNTITQATGTNAHGINITGSFGSGTIANNTISNVAGSGIIITSGGNGITIDNNTITSAVLNGIKLEGAVTMNNLTVTNNKINGVSGGTADATDEADGFGIKLRDFTSNNTLIQGNLIGVQLSGLVGTASPDLGCFKNGIYARANIAALSIDNNVICDNGNAESGREVCSGLFVTANGTSFGSVAITNNYVGVDKSGGKRGNDFAGINLRYVSGAFASVNISSNVVGDNGANTPGATNPNPLRRSHGIALQGFYASSQANFNVTSNYVGVFPGTFANVGNHANGIELYDCRNFLVDQNVIGFNKFETTEAGFTGAGLMVNGASQNGTLQSNYIGVGSGGQNIGNINPGNTNSTLANTNSGITIEQSTGLVIKSNTIKNNDYGIQIAKVGAVLSSGNTLTLNTVSNNVAYGILVSGGSGNTIGDATNAANGNILTGNGADAINVINTTSITNTITRNSIYCNTGQGIKLNYGASQGNSGLTPPVITAKSGNTVSGTAPSGAIIEIFADDPSCPIACGASSAANRREGKIYRATVTATGGVWTYTNATVATDSISATATLGSNTSEFSYCNILAICPTANAGSNQTLACNVTSTTLAATAPGTGESGKWTVVPANAAVTFNDVTAYNATVSGLPNGVTTLRWTLSRSGCPDDFKDITITVSTAVTASAGTNFGVCNLTTTSLSANNPSPGTGAWTTTSGSGVASTPGSNTSGVTGLTVGAATIFKWTVTNGACSANASVTVTSYASVTANAGSAQNVCNSTTATLAANNPSPGTGAWTTTSGTGVATTPGSNTSGVTGLTIGSSTTFLWTVTNGTCSATSSVTITSNANVTANAGTDFGVCNTTTASLSANNPSPGTGAWTTTSGSGVATTPGSNTSGVTGLTLGAATVFKWTVTNGACTANASVTVTSSAGVTANAGTAQSVCNATTATLAATTPSAGTGTWSTTSGTGTATAVNNPSSPVTGLTVGASTTFKWTVTNGTCSANASVTITSDAPVTANAGSNFGICNATTATLAGTNPSVGTGTWTVTSGTGSVTSIHTYNSGVTGLTVGTTSTFQWIVTNGSCTSGASAVTITVSSSPQSNAGTAQEVCNTTTGTLDANTTISAGTWTGPAGATFGDSHSPNTSVSGLTVGANTFTWSVTNGYCTTAATSTTTITVDVPSQSNAGSDQSFCNVTTASLNAGTSVGTGTWSGPSGVSITDPASPTSGVSGLAVGANVFTWSVKSGVCTAATSTMTITVSAPGTTSAGPDQGLCNITTTTLAGSGTGTWSPVSGTGVLTDPSNANSGVTGLTVGGTSVFQWTVTSGACSGSAQVSVTVSSPPTGVAGTDQGLCNATTTTLSATGAGSWTTASGTGLATDPTNTSSPVTGLTVGATSVFTWTVVNGSCTSTTNLSVVSSSPATSNAGSSNTLCNATTATLAAIGTGTWTTTTGTGLVTTPTDPNSGVTALTPGQSSDFTWTVTSGNCSATSTVTITSSAPVTADAGPAQSLCNVTTATLAGVGTGTWTANAISGTGSVTDISNGNSGVTGLTVGGSSSFTWTVTNGACSNAANVTISVSQGTTPDAGSDATLCNITSTTLGATGTGTWSITAGAGTIVDTSDPHTNVTVTTSPATFTWTINGGGCGSLSADVILTTVVLDKPTVSGSGTSGVCSGSTYTFNVTNVDAGATYNWTPSAVNSDVNLHTPTNTTSVDVDATSSDYIIVEADKGGCKDTAHVAVTVLPGLPSSGGSFHLATCADSLLLKTVLFDDNFYTGTWSSTDGGITFTPTTDSTFTLKNFTNGKDTLNFTVSGSCGTSTYTFYLQVGGEFLSAVMSGPSDTLCVGHNRELTMEVTPADTNNSYTYVWVSHVNFDHPVIDNTVHLDTTSVGVYNVSPDSDKNIYLGYVYDKYSGCQAAIDTARVYASTGQDLNVPNLITPNGDNQNDHWLLKDKVTHQDILPGSKFDLYNRWGQRVFTMDSYDNRFDAHGISDGIYFFNLKAGCGGKEYKGWLQILGNTNP